MQIYPLAYTQVDWRIFNQISQDILGVSPSKGIDASYLDIKDPAAYLASLDIENRPLDALRKHGPALDHCTFSFIGCVDTETLLCVHADTYIKVFRKQVGFTDHFVILSATIRDWVRSLEKMLSKDSHYLLRQLGTFCLSYFQQTGYREVFAKYKKSKAQDGTTILE